jgi:hypothetical protein
MKLSLPPKLMVFWVSIPPWMLMYFFAGFFNLTLCMMKLKVLLLCLSYFTDNSFNLTLILFCFSWEHTTVTSRVKKRNFLSLGWLFKLWGFKSTTWNILLSLPFEVCVHQILTLEKWETFHLSRIYYHANIFFENKKKF